MPDVTVVSRPVAVLRELHTPRVTSPGTTDLGIVSGGDVCVSLAGTSRALSVKADDSNATIDTAENTLMLRSPHVRFAGETVQVSAPETLTSRVGDHTAASSVGFQTSHQGLWGTRRADNAGSYLNTVADPDGSDLTLSTSDVPVGRESTVDVKRSGTIDFRSQVHEFFVGGRETLRIDDDRVTIRSDIHILGTLNSVGGSTTTLHVEDNIVEVASGVDGEHEVSSAPSGMCIESVPAARGDIPHMSAFRTVDGERLFVDRSDDEDHVDVSAAINARIFNKQFVHDVMGGSRQAGRLDTTSRSTEPQWRVGGGSLRISRYVPVASSPGTIHHYAMAMRVTDDGSFEVSRIKTILRHRANTTTFIASPPEYRVLQACEA